MTVLSPERTLLTTIFILSGVVNVVSSSQLCEERLEETAEVGPWVDVQATCYPNGTVSYNWNSNQQTQHLQIEYRCYNATSYQETPIPLVGWTDIKSDNRTLIVQPQEDCIFSGCYESGPEMQYRMYWIPNSTCSIYRVMTSTSALIMSSSPSVHMASTSLSPLQHSPSVSPTILPYSENTATTGWLIGVAVAIAVVVLITVGIMCLIIFKNILKNRKQTRPMLLRDDRIDGSYSPVLPELSKEISESSETIVCLLDYDMENESTPRRYIQHSSPEVVETDDTSFIDSMDEPNVPVPPYEHSESANANVLVGTQCTAEWEGSGVAEVHVTGTVNEMTQTEEEEEKEEKGKKKTCHDQSNYNRLNSDTYESLETKTPVDGFPTDELDPEEPNTDPLSMSFYTYSSYLHSLQANTSTTSGYITETNYNAMWNRTEEIEEADV